MKKGKILLLSFFSTINFLKNMYNYYLIYIKNYNLNSILIYFN